MPTLGIGEAQKLVFDALLRSRTNESNARSVARALVAAEADGLKGHGLSRVPSYSAQARVGKVDGMARPKCERLRNSVIRIDAAHGFAYPAIEMAEAELPAIVYEAGIAAAGIYNSHHCGAAGHPVERLALRGLIAMLFANTPAAIAPWGGSIALYGTNPIAFAVPLLDESPPIVIDLSLSKVARGNVLSAKQKGERIPADWALDAQGRPTTDPDAALAGTMVPIAEAKGTALALMVELLAAGLTGSNFAAEASSFLDADGPPPSTGQLLVVFDPSAFGANGRQRFATLASAIEAQSGVRVPGRRRMALRNRAERDGFAVSDALLTQIQSIQPL